MVLVYDINLMDCYGLTVFLGSGRRAGHHSHPNGLRMARWWLILHVCIKRSSRALYYQKVQGGDMAS